MNAATIAFALGSKAVGWYPGANIHRGTMLTRSVQVMCWNRPAHPLDSFKAHGHRPLSLVEIAMAVLLEPGTYLSKTHRTKRVIFAAPFFSA
jgi:hypothetical protein